MLQRANARCTLTNQSISPLTYLINRGTRPDPNQIRSLNIDPLIYKKGSHYSGLYCLIETVIDKNFTLSYKVGENMTENIFSNNKPKKYLYKIENKYFYEKNTYYKPVPSGPTFCSGKKKKMYLKNGKYIYINPPKPLEFFGPPPPPVLLPWHIQNLQPPKPLEFFGPPIYGQRGLIPYGYYYRNAEKVKQRMKDIRLAFNQTLPPLNLICEYCNKPFVLPGMNEKGHKQQPVKHCSYLCRKREDRFRKLWIPKWLFNYYLDKKLFQLVAGIKLRKHWKLSEFRSKRIPIYRVYQKLKTLFISNCGHNPKIYQRIKTVFFYKTITTEGKYTYKLKSLRRFLFGRERKNCLECGQSILHLAVDANYCNRGCYQKHLYSVSYRRPLMSILLGKYNYRSLKRNGIKRFLLPNINTLKRWKGHKIRIGVKIRILHYIITSPFINFYRFLFFKCRWCRIRLTGPVTQRCCSDVCNNRYKTYFKRWLPLWFYRHFYTRYDLYKIRWQYYPRVKNHIKGLVVHIIRFLKKKLKKSKKPYYIKKEHWLTCKHCQKDFVWGETIKRHAHLSSKSYVKNFCSADCRVLFKEAIVQRVKKRKKERNLAAWGTEERPDAGTRKRIAGEKRRLWENNKKKTDPTFKLLKRMRVRTRKVLKGIYKEGKVWNGERLNIFEKLGIKSGQELRDHIEALWEEGMNWDNYGLGNGFWVVDHHIPIKYWKNNFDLLNNLEIQRKCFGKENLKPMWWVDNAHKAAKLDYNGNK